MKKNILATIALMGALAWTACQKEQLAQDQPIMEPETIAQNDSVWTLSLRAVKTDDILTKGLAIGEGDTEAATTVLKSVWNTGDQVHVYVGDRHIGILSAVPDDGNPSSATLWGTVTTAGINPGVTTLTLLTPRQVWDYTGQNGSLLITDDATNSIEAKYNYTKAENIPVVTATGGVITTGTATFINQQSIYRMSFRYGDPKTAINTKSVSITGQGHFVQRYTLGSISATVTGAISVTLAQATTNPFFVAISNEFANGNEETFNFTVVDGDGITYKGSKTIPASYNNNGSFVSMKNATLTSRLDMPLNSTTKDVVL